MDNPVETVDDGCRTLWVRYTDGSLGALRCDGGEPVLAAGCAPISEAEYLDSLAAMEAVREANRESLLKADAVRQSSDYKALRGAGVPEELSRRLSGYTGT